MANIRVTKSFTFEMAHALWNYDGPCRNIHGHSYQLFVTVTGQPSEDLNDTKLGMVIDFSDLKRIVNQHVVEYFDHSIETTEDVERELGYPVLASIREANLFSYRKKRSRNRDNLSRMKKKSRANVKTSSDLANMISTVLPKS